MKENVKMLAYYPMTIIKSKTIEWGKDREKQSVYDCIICILVSSSQSLRGKQFLF